MNVPSSAVSTTTIPNGFSFHSGEWHEEWVSVKPSKAPRLQVDTPGSKREYILVFLAIFYDLTSYGEQTKSVLDFPPLNIIRKSSSKERALLREVARTGGQYASVKTVRRRRKKAKGMIFHSRILLILEIHESLHYFKNFFPTFHNYFDIFIFKHDCAQHSETSL